jgi:hypothetical protein
MQDVLSSSPAAKAYLAQLREAEAAVGSGSEDEATHDAVAQRLRGDALEVDSCCGRRMLRTGRWHRHCVVCHLAMAVARSKATLASFMQ